MVGRAILAHHTGTIDGEGHVQILHRHVMDELIVAALQEGGIDGHHRLHRLAGQTGRQGHRMLLGDRHIVVAFRVLLGEADQIRPLAHGRVMPIRRSSTAAMSHSQSPKTLQYLRGFGRDISLRGVGPTGSLGLSGGGVLRFLSGSPFSSLVMA